MKLKTFLNERQVKATAFFLSLVLLVVLTPGVIFKYQSAVPAFADGWGLIWACVAAALCCILIFARNPFQIVRNYYCVPALLLIAMAGQYACGIGWINGGYYSPGNGNSLDFYANPHAMVSPNILISFMWTHLREAQKVKLYKVSIQ